MVEDESLSLKLEMSKRCALEAVGAVENAILNDAGPDCTRGISR